MYYIPRKIKNILLKIRLFNTYTRVQVVSAIVTRLFISNESHRVHTIISYYYYCATDMRCWTLIIIFSIQLVCLRTFTIVYGVIKQTQRSNNFVQHYYILFCTHSANCNFKPVVLNRGVMSPWGAIITVYG